MLCPRCLFERPDFYFEGKLCLDCHCAVEIPRKYQARELYAYIGADIPIATRKPKTGRPALDAYRRQVIADQPIPKGARPKF